MLKGSDILVTGGNKFDALEFPADKLGAHSDWASGCRTVADGQERTGKPIETAVIPAGVLFRLRHIQDQVTYLIGRVDPDQTFLAGYAHPSIAN